ncbi:MAG: hypothetical protein EXQ52_01295 [Bryobacterales bacterium]|nr:hypothetical protein [Bryobacterales bacterium]
MRKLPLFVLGCAAVAAVVLWQRAEQQYSQARQRVAALEAELSRVPRSPAPLPSAGPAATDAAPPPETKIVRVPTGADAAEYIKIIEELRGRVAALDREIGVAREEAERAEVKAETESGGRGKLAAQVEDLKEDLQVARRISTALEAELRVKSDRLVQAETAGKLATERQTRAESAVRGPAAMSREIEDLNRRREVLVTSLQRRYREVTDTFRAISLNLQNREQSGSGVQAGDLSRVQSSIQQADDDMRQLQGLNARIAQLTRSP